MIVALHGFTGGGGDFAPLQEAVPEFAWLTPTLPGHSPQPEAAGAAGDDCTMAASLAYLDSLLPRGASTPWVLLGYSLGARLALRYALAHPHKVSALVLVAASPGIVGIADRLSRQKDDAALAERILQRGVPAFLDDWQRRPLIATQSRLPTAWQLKMQEQRRQLRAEGLAASLRQFGQGAVAPVMESLEELRLPILLSAGSEDEKYVEFARAMQSRLPQAELFLVPHAGHMAHLENLPAFAAGLRCFLHKHHL